MMLHFRTRNMAAWRSHLGVGFAWEFGAKLSPVSSGSRVGVLVGVYCIIGQGRGFQSIPCGSLGGSAGYTGPLLPLPPCIGVGGGSQPWNLCRWMAPDPPPAPRLNDLGKDGWASPVVLVAPLPLMKDLRSLAGVRGPRPVTIYGAGITLLFAVQQCSV